MTMHKPCWQNNTLTLVVRKLFVFESEGCQKVGTPEQDFIQVVNVSGTTGSQLVMLVARRIQWPFMTRYMMT